MAFSPEQEQLEKNIPDYTPQKTDQESKTSQFSGFLPEISMKMENLPSQGKAYPQGATVKYRPYQYGEVKKINQSNLTPIEQFKVILEGIETNFDKYQLSLEDAMYIAILRKISTINDSKVLIKYRCNHCDKVGEFEMPTKEIEFYDLQVPSLPMKANFSFGQLDFSLFTVQDFIDLQEMGDDYDKDMAYMAKCCVNKSFDAAYNLIYKMQQRQDIAILEKIDSYLRHGIKPVEHTCQNKYTDKKGEEKTCGRKVSVGLDGGQAIILPFRKDQVDVESNISFGN